METVKFYKTISIMKLPNVEVTEYVLYLSTHQD